MIKTICAWHKPEPIVMAMIDDGKPEVLETSGLCAACLARELEKVEAPME